MDLPNFLLNGVYCASEQGTEWLTDVAIGCQLRNLDMNLKRSIFIFLHPMVTLQAQGKAESHPQ